jgi:regulator of sirC expression with transglutaminase-like and TPR domain
MNADRERFAEVVGGPNPPLDLACLLIGKEVNPALDVTVGLAALDGLAEVVGAGLPGDATPAQIGRHLRSTLGADVGFGGSAADYDDLRSSLLHEVLRRRRGLPILLSVVWLEVARRLDVPAHGVGLPGHFVVGLGDPETFDPTGTGPTPGGFVLVDPFNSGVPLPPGEVYRMLGHAPTARDLRPADPSRILLRILANIGNWARRADRVKTRLWAIELTLLLPGCPDAVRREHGEALARAGNFAAAATQLEAYADRVEEGHPLAARTARQEARMARARLN